MTSPNEIAPLQIVDGMHTSQDPRGGPSPASRSSRATGPAAPGHGRMASPLATPEA
ncbi:hypothetical protein [Streptomyces atratus]|uniref:hypothetical protein n=1 Tax=Streptomyces atratus TaxID=1893 RepID=UPI003394BE68